MPLLAELQEAIGGTGTPTHPGDAPGQSSSGAAGLPNQDVSLPSSSTDQTAPKGTGVFMPMVGRSSSNSRSKPHHRRNASTSCLINNSTDSRSRQPRRNISSANLATPPAAPPAGQQHHNSLGAGPPISQGPLPSPDLSGAATIVMMVPSSRHTPARGPLQGGPFLGAQSQQQQIPLQQQRIPLQHQQLSPFALVSNATASGSPIPVLDGSLASTCSTSSMQGCLSVPVQGTHLYAQGSACMQHAGVPGPSTIQQQHSSGFLQGVSACAPLMQPARQLPADLQHPVLALSWQQGTLVRPVQGPAPISDSILAFPGTTVPAAGGQLGGSFLSGSNAVLLSGPQVSTCDSLLSQWASLGLSEQDLLSALTSEPSRETALDVQQGVIEQNINKLNVMKRLLHLKQQHKTQQQLLQLQQQQQEQLLEQQLLGAGSVTASPDSMQQLHQDLMQLLQMHGGSGSSGGSLTANSALQTAGGHASAPQINSLGLALPVSAAGNPLTPTLTPGLLQHLPSTVQDTDAATLSSLLQQRLCV